MTLEDIRRLVASVDPEAGHYESAHQGKNSYTVWRERGTLPFTADDAHQGAVRFQIDRFTRDEFDSVAREFFQALEADPRVAFAAETDYERDTRYIHHIFVCEGL